MAWSDDFRCIFLFAQFILSFFFCETEGDFDQILYAIEHKIPSLFWIWICNADEMRWDRWKRNSLIWEKFDYKMKRKKRFEQKNKMLGAKHLAWTHATDQHHNALWSITVLCQRDWGTFTFDCFFFFFGLISSKAFRKFSRSNRMSCLGCFGRSRRQWNMSQCFT